MGRKRQLIEENLHLHKRIEAEVSCSRAWAERCLALSKENGGLRSMLVLKEMAKDVAADNAER